MSDAFRRFEFSFFHDPKSAQDALDTASLAALTGDERGLLALHGLSYDVADIQSMVYRVMADDSARREGGKRDVLAAIAGRAMVP